MDYIFFFLFSPYLSHVVIQTSVMVDRQVFLSSQIIVTSINNNWFLENHILEQKFKAAFLYLILIEGCFLEFFKAEKVSPDLNETGAQNMPW